ncbi:MAG: hypothetical protein HOF70_19370 [Rhodospirillaceae bacterium]|jgi:uncharacterized surface protein with fasciclin (FAS1) repeats|nr:hypothetical protein [Rhodospirillaceae bacterium]MBT4117732.1 hypothetical protein [Rhodospirillaceae bacterium]MBT4672804.1 hypothetical protein [Rhodospirillaceae bacterium]MBT4719964.1 hypothetical protein [Rhodospirillaceae bacterium]MBT5177472.1 hypothetical protein [Rhodospirillaceae bacterium]
MAGNKLPVEQFEIVTVLWGARFVDRFLSMTLATILAPGNIPALANDRRLSYRIFTGENDERRLRASPLFQRLEQFLPVNISVISTRPDDGKYRSAIQHYIQAMQDTRLALAPTILLQPDAIWADGALMRIAELADAGYAAIMTDGLRVIAEHFMPAFEDASLKGADGSLSIRPRALMELAMDFIHPYEASVTWNSKFIHDVPFRLHWPVPGGGIVTQGFCYNPIYLAPEKYDFGSVKAMDHGLVDAAITNLDRVYYCQDSDDVALVSIDEEGYSGANYKRADRRQKILTAASWAYREATPENLLAATKPVRRHFAEIDEAKWRRVERVSRASMGAVLTSRKIFLVLSLMKRQGLTLAPAMLAYLLYQGPLTGWLRIPGPMTVFAPADAALEALGRARLNDLLSSENKAEVLDMLAMHMRPGHLTVDQAAGHLGAAKIIKGDLEAEDWTLHIIDQPLVASALERT